MFDSSYLFQESNSSDIQCEEYGTATKTDGKLIFDGYTSMFCLAYIRRGSLTTSISSKTWTFGQGSVVLVQPNSAFVLREVSNDFQYLYICFSGAIPSKLFRSPQRVRVIKDDSISGRCALFMDVAKAHGLSFELRTIALISDILSCFIEEEDEHESADKHTDIVDEFISYVSKNYMSDFDIRDVCREIGISVNYFTNRFTKIMHVSPKQFVIDVRINKAKDILRSTSLSIGEVSSYVGYNEPLHFSKEFKKRVGISPAEYRKQQKNIIKEFDE